MSDHITPPRTVHLEVNDRGGWRRVMSCDLDTVDDQALEHAADWLLRLADNPRLRARIIMAGEISAPLVTWSRDDGWREWVHPGQRQGALA